ncbi:hypothetical protein OJ593_11115, partial [Streptococcus anginosus]|uniref:hypothetical protein n=1 Tax=Streptococcus anginosus TaxID=1328 RepID=UPI0021F831FC
HDPAYKVGVSLRKRKANAITTSSRAANNRLAFSTTLGESFRNTLLFFRHGFGIQLKKVITLHHGTINKLALF